MASLNEMKPRVNGDERDRLITTYLNVSSGDRDRSVYPTSNECQLSFDKVPNVLSMDILNFEIPHTRYAIDQTNNTFYLSEKIAEGSYNFFGLKASTGGYTISNLAVSLELSIQSPTVYASGTVLCNTYNFLSSGPFGKVAVISSGDVEYNIHTCIETLQVTSFTKSSDTEASVVFLAPYEYILAPGALLTLKIHSLTDREVQVITTTAPRTVTIIGDFSDFIDSDVLALLTTMVPYSSRNPVAEVAGFGLVDLEISKDTQFAILAMGSPFAKDMEDGVMSPMILLNVPAFLSSDDYCTLIDTIPFLDGGIYRVGITHDDTHFQLDIDPDTLWAGTSITVATLISASFNVTSIAMVSSDKNVVLVTVTPDSDTGFIVGDVVEFTGFTETYLDGVVFTVDSLDVSTDAFNVSFQFETSSLVRGQSGSTIESTIDAMDGFDDGITYLAPVNPTTGLRTTYICPNRFDLSRGRRVILVRATVDEQDIGNIFIPNSRDRFFARIQLFSGADLVNFLNTLSAIGHHNFNGIVKRLHDIRFRFYNEDGTAYDFNGVDWALFIRITSLDSNTGL